MRCNINLVFLRDCVHEVRVNGFEGRSIFSEYFHAQQSFRVLMPLVLFDNVHFK